MKRSILIIFLVVFPCSVAIAQYQIDWWVMGSGGGHSESGSYKLDGTIGQPIVGQSSSANYRIDVGFWVGAAPQGPVCDYVVGDANGNGSFNGLDVTYSVAYFKGGPPPPYECECTSGNSWFVSGDVNSSCNFNGLDVTYMVAYLKGGPPPHPCPDCPPGGRLAPPIPGGEPIPPDKPAESQP
jgi:hypothetical protein